MKISKEIKNIYKNDNFIFIIFFILILMLYSRCTLRYGTDDTMHIETIKNIGIFNWIYLRMTTWQPRIFSDLFFAILNFDMRIWSIFNAIMSTSTIIMIIKISTINFKDEKAKKYATILLCSLYFCIYPFTLNSATFWYAGSFYYLWPTVFLLISIYPYLLLLYNKNLNFKISILIMYLSSIISSYTEQSLAIQICFIGIILIYCILKKIKIYRYLIYNYFLIIINSIIFLVINFSSNRIDKELHWYPDYPMLTSVDKIFQGINWTNYYYINSSNIIFFILILFLTILIWKNNNLLVSSIFSFPIVYMTLNLIPFGVLFQNLNRNNFKSASYLNTMSSYLWGEKQFDFLFNTMFANPSNLNYSFRDLLPSFLGIFLILNIIYMISLSFKNSKDLISSIFLYIAALMSGYIMALSPTIFASGVRVFYPGTILIFIVIIKLFLDIFESKFKYLKIIVVSLCIISVPMYLQLFFVISKMGEIF